MPVSFRKLAIVAIGLALPLSAAAQIAPLPAFRDPHAMPLLPGAKDSGEQWESFMGSRILRNVTAPTLTPVLPDPAKANGAAVIVAPGGAFMMLSIDSEGYDVAHWLADHGVAAFVLTYRLKPTARDPGAFFAQLATLMSGGDPARDLATPVEALADARAAIGMVRQGAGTWHIDPARIGFLGFSAGAMTAIDVGLTPDASSRPDFIAPIYGPMSARPIPRDAPPMFAAMALDDPLFGHGDLGLIGAYQAAGRPIEVHLFETGGHGFGMRHQGKTSDLWIDEFHAWMKDRGLLKPAG
jgi:acetyl esterase/lipase